MAAEQNSAGGPGGKAQDRLKDLEEIHPSGDEVIKGARNEDQLDKMNQTANLTNPGDVKENGQDQDDTTHLITD